MKRFITAALIAILAPAAMASASYPSNQYNRVFVVYTDSTLPTLKIMSVTPAPQKALTSATIVGDGRLQVVAYPSGTSSDRVEIPVRIGYDATHYANVAILISNPLFFGLQTSVVNVDAVQHGVWLKPQKVSKGGSGSINLYFTKK